MVADLRLGGMAKMLADHCELVSQAGDAVTLRVGEAHKHLLDRTYQDKLVGALRDKHGATLQVTFEIGKAAEQTPQQVRTRIREARQAEAVAAIESDPFVRELVDQFGGQIDASTIQPLVPSREYVEWKCRESSACGVANPRQVSNLAAVCAWPAKDFDISIGPASVPCEHSINIFPTQALGEST